jgi:hypothetical protein
LKTAGTRLHKWQTTYFVQDGILLQGCLGSGLMFDRLFQALLQGPGRRG